MSPLRCESNGCAGVLEPVRMLDQNRQPTPYSRIYVPAGWAICEVDTDGTEGTKKSGRLVVLCPAHAPHIREVSRAPKEVNEETGA